MSIFALNFKFDLQETGGKSDWQSLTLSPSLDSKHKNKLREKQMKHVFEQESKKMQETQRREQQQYIEQILEENEEDEKAEDSEGMSEQEKIYYKYLSLRRENIKQKHK